MTVSPTGTARPSADDLAFGPGASTREKALAYAAGGLLMLFVLWLYFAQQLNWPFWKLFLALLIALDLGAGAIANILPSCRRFYQAPPQPTEPAWLRWMKSPLFFTALHIYPIIAGLVYGPWNWAYALGGYALLLLACWLVLRAPAALQRPLAYFAVLVALTVPLLLNPPAGMEWLMPVLFIKLIVGHTLNEGET